MPIQRYPIQVNFNLSLREMIHAGKYDAVNFISPPDQTALPAPHGMVAAEVELLTFDRDYALPEMVAETHRRGYRPATLPEFLALGAQYPDLQKQFWILTLGSVETKRSISFRPTLTMQEEQFIPCLFTWLGERALLAGSFDGKYRPGCCFVCVRKDVRRVR